MKINIFVLVLVFLCTSTACYSAIMVGNPPGFPEKNKFSFGAEYWDVSSIEMEYDDNVQDEFTLVGQAIRASYGLSDILALDLRIGQADFENNYDEGTMWGLGVRAIIFESTDGFKLMGGFQYCDYTLDETEIGGFTFEAEPNSSVASIDISKLFADRLTLYAGVDYAYMKFKYSHNGFYGDREGGYEQIDEFGYYGGADIRLFKGLSLFAEGHFENEDAYVLGILYKLTGKAPAPEEKSPAVPPEGEKTSILADKFHVGAEVSRFTDKKMTEEGGFVPLYDKYRISSDRMFAVFSYDLIDRISIFTKLGTADLETHSSEGETTAFDSEFAYTIGSKCKLFEIGKDVWISGEVSYLSYSPEDEETTSSAKHAANTGGDLSIEWSELNASVDVSKRINNTLLFGGVEYINVTADQDRAFADGITVSSTFEADDNVGVFAGFQYWFTDAFSVMFRADIITERQYTFGASFSF